MSQNRGVGHLQKFKLNFIHQSQTMPQKSNLPYLSNGDTIRYKLYIFGTTIVENGGVGHIKIPKKVCSFFGDTHVTLNPKPQKKYAHFSGTHM